MNFSKEPCLACPVSLFCVAGIRFDVYVCQTCRLTAVYVDAEYVNAPWHSLPSFGAPEVFNQKFLDTVRECQEKDGSGVMDYVHPVYVSHDDCYECSLEKSP